VGLSDSTVSDSTVPGEPFRELGGGVRMPMLGLGVWQLEAGAETEQAVEWALQAGYRHIDTAAYYRNEASVGAAVARSGLPREQVFVTTKWLPVGRGPLEAIERSLERLALAYVDCYLVHWPLPGRSAKPWRDFETIHERGLARSIGVSNYGERRLEGLLGAGTPPAVNQVHFSPLHSDLRLLEWCEARGVVVEAYSPLERGRGIGNAVIAGIAAELERTPAQVMLRWGLQHGMVVIPKSARRERIEENARIFDFELGAEQMAALDSLGAG
jgi:2,5-diketo-D-gluconate reductase A